MEKADMVEKVAAGLEAKEVMVVAHAVEKATAVVEKVVEVAQKVKKEAVSQAREALPEATEEMAASDISAIPGSLQQYRSHDLGTQQWHDHQSIERPQA